MTKAQELYKELQEIERKIADLKDEAERTRGHISELISPYKVGDEAEVKGYSHKGKKCVIDRVTFVNNRYSLGRNDNHDLIVNATILRKGGDRGQQTVSWKGWDDDTIETALNQLQKQG
jgi:hypothetical protein